MYISCNKSLLIIGSNTKPIVKSTITSSPSSKKSEDIFSFEIQTVGLNSSPQIMPYQFSTPLSCNSVFVQDSGARYPQEHTEPTCTNIRRRRKTRNVHFMMAGGKMSSSGDSPINLVDLDKSMDMNTS